MQRGRDRQEFATTPTEQPPRKLSGKRTAQQEHLESGARAPTEGDSPPVCLAREETLRYMDRWGIDADFE
ncbi:hypothetical protein LMG27177_06131 [Paraburkholderia fynbosensis]|uniref:Uncharacterized protein n=1 Tax=Paraburkholderia fynbosensis TaxID=1200993 RepID=A0A6J5GWB3_9BURK|nr:hypothetical protein LMG27177_06131 [Paraburkholderia fynbosensis]